MLGSINHIEMVQSTWEDVGEKEITSHFVLVTGVLGPISQILRSDCNHIILLNKENKPWIQNPVLRGTAQCSSGLWSGVVHGAGGRTAHVSPSFPARTPVTQACVLYLWVGLLVVTFWVCPKKWSIGSIVKDCRDRAKLCDGKRK